MWSTGTLSKINARRLSKEEKACQKMQVILGEYGLQVTLKALVDSVEQSIKKLGKTSINLILVESLQGIYKGYSRRHEPFDDEDKLK